MGLSSLCGALVLGGFGGTSLPDRYARALREGRRGGATLFRANVEGGPLQVGALCRQVHDALPAPLLGIDQEGGRVARLGPPALRVPPMQTVGSWNDTSLAERIARAVGSELAALGVTINFAPVLDVRTREDNPVIGDRAFGRDAATCARFGAAWIRGLQSSGLLATAKHFPGHGDTPVDSHFELPVVAHPRERLLGVELVPFAAAVAAGVEAIMTAHVVYSALDPERPATLSHTVCTELRDLVGFRGLLLSDDLEMKAIASRYTTDDAAVQAVAAGCDALLVCHSEEEQERAFDGLVREAERSTAFRARCAQAHARTVEARRRAGGARPLDDRAIAELLGGAGARAMAAEMAKMGAS